MPRQVPKEVVGIFSTTRVDRLKSELMLALVPNCVGNISAPAISGSAAHRADGARLHAALRIVSNLYV